MAMVSFINGLNNCVKGREIYMKFQIKINQIRSFSKTSSRWMNKNLYIGIVNQLKNFYY